ncbi:glycosyltransferase family 4 protein [Albirhodobacter sp. R86504]|uniref:glycosyltransferase family 4 protein n=1 Tax=Albirhodobacter sp. R86504 TaxID=3093848 RepID=UPI00366DE998
MSFVKLRIIHETNPKKYFPALYELAESEDVKLVGAHRYSVCKEWLRAWLRDRTPLLTRTQNALGDLALRARIPFISGETIVIGFAPWDWRLLIYRHLAARNRILYQTSWHDWRLEATPRQPKPLWLKLYLQKQWHRFVAHPNVRVIAVTPTVAKTVLAETNVAATVIPHAVPEVFFEAGRARGPSSTGPLKLLYVGEISEKKGIRQLLTIMQALSAEDVVLSVVGNGPLVDEVKAAGGKVTYLGPIYDRTKLAETMASHDILMLLSQRTKTWEELFGIVIVEAIAAGCAVIATDHIGPVGILGEGETVGLFDEKDSQSVLTLLRTIRIDRENLTRLRGAQQVAAQYSTQAVKSMWRSQL